MRMVSAGGNQKNATIDAIIDSGTPSALNYFAIRNGVLGSEATRLFIDYLGNVGIGTTSPSYPLDVTGDIRTSTCIRTSAGVSAGTCTSDARLKTNIHSFTLGLEALLGITPRYFKYNGLGGQEASKQDELGVIAQEVEKSAPELISDLYVKLKASDKEKTKIKSVNYNGLLYMAINSIKEFYGQFKAIVARVINLENKELANERAIASIKAENAQLKKENAIIKARMDQIEKILLKK